MISVLAALLGLACVLFAPAASAEGTSASDPRARAEAAYHDAEKADDALDLARALELYDAVRTIDPGSRYAPRAEARGAVLRAHAEAGFAPFAALERVRRDPALASDAKALGDLVALAEQNPGTQTQVEIWVLAAEAYAYRLGRPADAARLYERVVNAPHADPVVAKKAARDLVTMRLAIGDLAGAQAALAAAKSQGHADDRLARDVRRAVRRALFHRVARAVVIVVVALAASAIARASLSRRGAERRAAIKAAVRKTSRLAVVYAIYVAVAGGLLASRYEGGTSAPFLVLGIVIAPLALLARAWAAAGGPSPAARIARATACAASAMAAAFLVLEGVNASFLDGMGL
ncbi:MAG: hypothetical protein JST00_27985 [Deltaproteobacteria bacterium]|nr:hypothetical protein [Deltaproteobacteria bacterium]